MFERVRARHTAIGFTNDAFSWVYSLDNTVSAQLCDYIYAYCAWENRDIPVHHIDFTGFNHELLPTVGMFWPFSWAERQGFYV